VQEERKRIGLLFATARYETARQEIQGMLPHVEDGEREFWQAMETLVEGYGDWDNFNPKSARNRLGRDFSFLSAGAIESKYEDAVARLYSGLERGAKFRLQRQYGVSTDDVKVDQIPEVLREEFAQKYGHTHEGKIKLSLVAAYRLLDGLGDELGQHFVAQQDEIQKLLSLRNLSPLGHGENPVGPDGYGRFRALLVELLGIDEAALPKFAPLPL